MKRMGCYLGIVIIAGCGASQATPPSQNPLLANGISPVQLYKWVHKGNTHLNKNVTGRSRMCVAYEVKRAKAKALPEKARQKIQVQVNKDTKQTCSDYEKQIAPLIAKYSGLDISNADIRTPELWTKYNKGRVAHVMQINPNNKNQKKQELHWHPGKL